MSVRSKSAFARYPLVLLCAGSLALGACGEGKGSNNGNNGSMDAGMSNDVSEGGDDTGTPDGGDDDVGTTECGEPTGMRPPRLSEHAGAFVDTGDGAGTLVVFGGSLGIPENCNFPERTYETTTWLYDVECDSWSQLDSSATPAGRTRHTAVYDSTDNRVVVFGGLGAGGSLNDTWALDMESGEWSELETTGGPPPARLNHAAAYDPEGNRMFIFGGNQGSSVINISPSNDVWALDLSTNTWSDVTPAAAGPDPRLWTSALWDPDQSQLVIFGGGDDSAFTGNVDYFEDVWAWSDGGGDPTWEQLDAGSNLQPEGRFWAGWTYDPVNQQYLLFGGHDDTNLGNKNDTWFFDPASGQWTEHLTGDIPNAPANGVCDFPADFTTIEEASPERRNAHVFSTGPTAAYAMGGKTDCGVIDDLVRFNFETQDWEVLTRAIEGEVCLRKGGGDTCSSLCL